LFRNSGASAFWNRKGLSRPVAGKLYLFAKLGQLVPFNTFTYTIQFPELSFNKTEPVF
jgi:hypothetical protein